MKIVQIIPRRDSESKLKTMMNAKERELRRKGTTLIRQKAGRWKHAKYPGWINWDESQGGVVVATIQSRVPESEWQLLSSFIGYIDRHFGEEVESIAITYR